jgi:hypothetical protein
MQHRIIGITGFKILGPHTLWLRFADGLERTIDFSEVLAGEMYKPLTDPEYLAQVRLDPEVHTIVWPNGADFDPETLYNWPEVECSWRARIQQWTEQLASTNGPNSDKPRNVNQLAGTWTEEQANKFDREVASFNQVDENLWK